MLKEKGYYDTMQKSVNLAASLSKEPPKKEELIEGAKHMLGTILYSDDELHKVWLNEVFGITAEALDLHVTKEYDSTKSAVKDILTSIIDNLD